MTSAVQDGVNEYSMFDVYKRRKHDRDSDKIISKQEIYHACMEKCDKMHEKCADVCNKNSDCSRKCHNAFANCANTCSVAEYTDKVERTLITTNETDAYSETDPQDGRSGALPIEVVDCNKSRTVLYLYLGVIGCAILIFMIKELYLSYRNNSRS